MNNRFKILFLIFICILCAKVQAQNLIFKTECFIGNEIHTQKYDTIKSNDFLDIQFYNKHFQDFIPAYFPKNLTAKRAQKKPMILNIENGYRVEYFDKNNRLVKYSIYVNSRPDFDVNIFYYDSNIPFKIIEYFPEFHHSENGLFSTQFDLKYNDKNELIEIEVVDNNGYVCRKKN